MKIVTKNNIQDTGILSFSLISLPSPDSHPIFHPSLHPPLMRHNRYMGEFVAVACRGRMSEVCEEYKKKYLQQKCLSRMSHITCV